MGMIKYLKGLFNNTNLAFEKVELPESFAYIVVEQQKKTFSTDKIKILMISDFSEFLDNYTPIFAVNECNKEKMNIQLDIYGQGRDLNKIKTCIKNQNCENIQYKGSFQDFHSVFLDYDLFITSSYSFDAQIQTIGAMRAGLPLLLMDIKDNGSCEFICNNGYLIPSNSVLLYYKTLKSIYENKSHLITMGQNSRNLFEERYLARRD